MNTLLKLSKKAVPFILVLTVCMVSSSNPKVKAAPVTFSDIPANHWAKSGIDTAVNKGYVVGYPGGLFMPNANVTRAEFIKMIVTATGQPVEETTGKWYESYVEAAEQAALYTKSDFANSDTEWNKKITRNEMARIAARATGLKTNEADKWMYLATKTGLISGLGAGKLGEKEYTTRAQSVATVERVLTVKSGGKLPTDKYAIGSAELAWHKTNIFTVMPEVFKSGDPTIDLTVAELWKEDKLKIATKDKMFIEHIDAVIAIDLTDKNDPNLKLVPPLSTLKWKNTTDNIPKGIPVTKSMSSYLIYFKTTVDFSKYDFDVHMDIGFIGFALDWGPFMKGNLNSIANVFQKTPGDLAIKILPKTGWKRQGDLQLLIRTPSGEWNGATNEILKIPQAH
ncbi:hypothetical protein A3844_19235 [Paenibacillus helianthi]|uniref:SLH domain-containing protein n=1 Tax=Paenibacillus helianthi TaxID=1349432 RepID=A0ABX3EM48_9BACL|nr:S-layer homology domain-containing protein [Paenibacillus helianthi]OKP84624.1 hypothetical protein A3844_19235 [Paenibacillus helianthi]